MLLIISCDFTIFTPQAKRDFIVYSQLLRKRFHKQFYVKRHNIWIMYVFIIWGAHSYQCFLRITAVLCMLCHQTRLRSLCKTRTWWAFGQLLRVKRQEISKKSISRDVGWRKGSVLLATLSYVWIATFILGASSTKANVWAAACCLVLQVSEIICWAFSTIFAWQYFVPLELFSWSSQIV